MKEKKSSLTVADVAREAKVSKATAARVLGDYGIASEGARKAVLEAAARLGYQPNDLARSMSTGRSGLVGVIVGDIENAFFSQAVRGISDTLRAAGLNLIISNSNERLSEEVEMVSVLLRQRVAGLIVAPTNARCVEHLKAALASGTPVVTLDRWSPELEADAVCGDDRESVVRVMRRLQDFGHQQIGYVTAWETLDGTLGNFEEIGISAVRERIAGFLTHTREAGVEKPAKMVFTGAIGADETAKIVSRILGSSPAITAILASDSIVGSQIFRELSDRGLKLPQDMSLVSWFDADWTRVTSPRISVVDQPTYQFGQKAAERLIARLKGDDTPPERFVIKTPFLERGTIGSVKTK